MTADPRITLLMVVALNALTLTYGPLSVVIGAAILTVLLLALSKHVTAAAIVALVFTVLTATFLLFQQAPGWAGSLGLLSYWLSRFALSIGFGMYAIVTIRTGELIAALRAIHTPQWLTIPIAVMLRMLPIIKQEAAAIREAMVLRGLQPGVLGTLTHPLKHGELVVIPLISTVVRAGDELAAAALIRGLGGPAKPTSVTPLRFNLVDALIVVSLIVLSLMYFKVIP
ncbi:energy-coupling factor transporter transmembrane component T [Corynebacterium sp.]|uniref:energy-coupling factor transporter transmembrane component T n=1 Tax=Corynebacterium sp. TaxID=1720 RepID=UPI0026DB9210|nr:energy-coupling factor transporter transmembrane component T [Corynebacterium sp.]MDO5076355.1 energy-coupling factor transporter transmembrane component T [Corynebacterium sp.]